MKTCLGAAKVALGVHIPAVLVVLAVEVVCMPLLQLRLMAALARRVRGTAAETDSEAQTSAKSPEAAEVERQHRAGTEVLRLEALEARVCPSGVRRTVAAVVADRETGLPAREAQEAVAEEATTERLDRLARQTLAVAVVAVVAGRVERLQMAARAVLA
jgi:hypothetical protein